MIDQAIQMKSFRLALAVLCLSSPASHALDSEQQRGKALLQRLCSRCHAIGISGASPHPDAPPFRTFDDLKLYDEDFAQRLQTGLSTIHRDMPSFRFDQADAEAVLHYLRAIQVHQRPK
jgi:mono/diheme cytochrome c family protein